jgi:hypothetical protein
MKKNLAANPLMGMSDMMQLHRLSENSSWEDQKMPWKVLALDGEYVSSLQFSCPVVLLMCMQCLRGFLVLVFSLQTS